MIPTADFIKRYHDNKQQHPYYKDCAKYANELRIHFDALPPGDLISKRRPAESEEIKAYRELIYVCKTQSDCEKIQNSLMKIRKSQDWVIRYPVDAETKIAEGETLHAYMEESFPRYESFTNWYFQLGFRTYLTDANAVVLWMPLNTTVEDNKYYKPYPFIFKCEQVLDYVEANWYMLKSNEKYYFVEDGIQRAGNMFYFVDADGIYTIKQVSMAGRYIVEEFVHGLQKIPVVNFGGIVQDESIYYRWYKSRISGIVPSFNEAIREYSDLQAEVVQHVHSTMWAEEGQECVKCKGTGQVPKKNSEPIACTKCNATGRVPFNPFEYFLRKKPKAGEPASTGVPLGYVQKQVEIVKIQDERVRAHRKDGLSAINMEFLIDPPQLVNSGESKKVDREELNNFTHAIAEDIVKFFDQGYYFANEYRYSGIIPNPENRKKQLPQIPVPEKYDLLSESFLAKDIEMLKRTDVEPSIINASLVEYVNKKFNAEPDIKHYVSSVVQLDPFASEKEESILLKKTNSGITEENYIIHCNIKEFVTRAIHDPKIDFENMDFEKKSEVMKKYAQEIISSNSAKEKVVDMSTPSVNPDEAA